MRIISMKKFGGYGYGIISEDNTKWCGFWKTKDAAMANLVLFQTTGSCFGEWRKIPPMFIEKIMSM